MPTAEKVPVIAVKQLTLRFEQGKVLRLASYCFRHPCLRNATGKPLAQLTPPPRTFSQLTPGKRAMLLLLVAARVRSLEAGPDRNDSLRFDWVGPAGSPVASLAQALDKASQPWFGAWFGYSPLSDRLFKVELTRALFEVSVPRKQSPEATYRVSLRQPTDADSTPFEDFVPLSPACFTICSTSKGVDRGESELDDLMGQLFKEGNWRQKGGWQDEPASPTTPIRESPQASETARLAPLVEGAAQGDGPIPIARIRYTREVDPASGRITESVEVVVYSERQLEQVPAVFEGIRAKLAQTPAGAAGLEASEQRKRSILLTLRATPEQAQELLRLAEAGELRELGITAGWYRDEEPDADDPRVEVPVAGSWYARPQGRATAEWRLVARTPGLVRLPPATALRFRVDEGVADADLARLRSLTEVPLLEELDLSACERLTEAGVAVLRGLNPRGRVILPLGIAWRARLVEEMENLRPGLIAIASRVAPSEDADDIVQEALIRAYRNVEKFDPSRPLRPWLAQVTRHVGIDRLRAAMRRPSQSPAGLMWDVADGNPAPVERDIRADFVARFRSALATLSPRFQGVLVAHLAGATLAEIGQRFNRSPSTIYKWVAWAKAELLDALGDEPITEGELRALAWSLGEILPG